MALIKYNNRNLFKFPKSQILDKKIGIELASGALGISGASAASGATGVSGASGTRTFDINAIQERLNNKDLSVLQELDAQGIQYTFNERADGYDFECTYNGQHYEIHYTDPNADTGTNDDGMTAIGGLKGLEFSNRTIESDTNITTGINENTYTTLDEYIERNRQNINEQLMNEGYSESDIERIIWSATANIDRSHSDDSISDKIQKFNENIEQIISKHELNIDLSGDVEITKDNFDSILFGLDNPCLNYLREYYLDKLPDGSTEFCNAFLSRIVSLTSISNLSDLANLSINGNDWFDSLISIIDEEASKIRDTDHDLYNGINIEAFFGDKELLTADDIFAQIDDMVLSNDASVRRFAKFFRTFDNNDLLNKELLENLIICINNKLGIENTVPPVFTKQTLSKLNEQGSSLFKTIEDIKFRDEEYLSMKTNTMEIINSLKTQGFSEEDIADIIKYVKKYASNSLQAGFDIYLNQYNRFMFSVITEGLSCHSGCSSNVLSSSSNAMSVQYARQLINNCINEYGLDEHEKSFIYNQIWNDIVEKFDNGMRIECNFFELINTIKETLKNINNTNNIDDVTVLNPQALFEYGNSQDKTISPEQILQNFENMFWSEDASVRKFARILQRAFDENGCSTKSQQLDLIEAYIKLLNQGCHLKSDPPVLDHKIVNIMTERGDIFTQLENLSENDALKNLYKINGKIGDFEQRQTGDCWLLAAIKALSTTEAGAELIRNGITWNDDYSAVKVYFAGTGDSIEISIDDILVAIDAQIEGTNGYRYSSGDLDVIILEMAMERLYRNGNNNSGQSDEFWQTFVGSNIKSEQTNSYDKTLSQSSVSSWLTFIYLQMNTGKNFAGTFYLGVNSGSERICNTKDGGIFRYAPSDGGGHAFAITDITPNSITFKDPHDTNGQTYTVSWNEFINLGIKGFSTVSF